MAELNWDKLGMKPSKECKPLWHEDYSKYQRAIDWMRDFLKRQWGLTATTAMLDPDLDLWLFYDEDGRLLIRVAHTSISYLHTQLELQQFNDDIDRFSREPRSQW